MDWILVSIVVLLILSIIWFIMEYKKDLRKDKEIFDEHLENQRRIKFNRRGRDVKYSKKDRNSFSS